MTVREEWADYVQILPSYQEIKKSLQSAPHQTAHRLHCTPNEIQINYLDAIF